MKDNSIFFVYFNSFLYITWQSSGTVGQSSWQWPEVICFLWVAQCGKLIPQWSHGCLEACCVWSLTGHFNISLKASGRPPCRCGNYRRIPLIILPPSVARPQPAAALCHILLSHFPFCPPIPHCCQNFNTSDTQHKVCHDSLTAPPNIVSL